MSPAPDDLLSPVPRLLLVLAGACTVSAAIGLVAVAMSGERPPTLVLAVPPALAAAWILLRRRGRGGGA